MAKLWDYFDGEPFMENPHLAIIGNPYKVGSVIERKKSGFRKISQKGKKMAAKRRGKKNSPKRRRARRNPFPLAGIAVNRPRRRRKARTYSMNKRRGVYTAARRNPRRRKSYRRNPAVLGVALPPINMIAWGAGGFIAPPMVEGFVNKFLPVEVTSSVIGRYAVKIGAVLGLTWLAKSVLSNKEAFPIALGGSLYVVVSAVNEFIPQLTAAPAPAPAVSAYRTGMVKAYRGGMVSTGIGQYSRTGLANRALPMLAQPSDMMQRFDIDSPGMKNPVFADPRFTSGIAR